jgi:zinc protease
MKKLFGLMACLAWLASSTTLGAEDDVKLPPFSKVELRNGMTLILMEQKEVPIVSFSFLLKAGSVADPKGKEGLASLTADLLRKGTKTRSSSQIASDLDFIGGLFDMSASTDFTLGSAEFLKKDLDVGLELTADILLNPSFPQDEVTKLIEQNVDGIKAAKDRAQNVISRYFYSYLFGTHPYARPVGGDETSLAAITRADVQNFYQGQYVPSNMIMAVVGDFNTSEMRGMIEKRFEVWPAKAATPVRVAEPVSVKGRKLLLVDKPDSTQTYFYIGNLGISRTNPDRVGIIVMNTLFGGRFTSRLNTALRVDSGLTYGANSSFSQRSVPGPFVISTYTRNATTEQAIDMALDVLKNFHEKGITQEELDSAKTYLKGQFPTSIETTNQLASQLVQLEFYGLDRNDIDTYTARIDKMTLAEARRITRQYFPLDNLVFALIGKAGEIESIAKKYAPALDRKSITAPGF